MGLFGHITKGNVVLTQHQEKALLEEIRLLPYRMIAFKSLIKMCKQNNIEYSIEENAMTLESEDPRFYGYINMTEEREHQSYLNSLHR